MKNYDYLIVGAGLFGSTFANLAKKDGKKVLVIDRRCHIGGNIYTENEASRSRKYETSRNPEVSQPRNLN